MSASQPGTLVSLPPPPASPVPGTADNLQPVRFPSPPQPEQDTELQGLYSAVVEKLEQTIRWYGRRKRSHKRWGLTLRMAAVVLAGLASITPIVLAMLPRNPQHWDPVNWVPLASLLAALGAGCIGMDRLLEEDPGEEEGARRGGPGARPAARGAAALP